MVSLLRSGSFMDAVPIQHRERVVTAGFLRRTLGLPKALTRRNFNPEFQAAIRAEILGRRDRELGNLVGLPPALQGHAVPKSLLYDRVEQFYKIQGALIELGNRLGDKDFTPYPREAMRPLTAGTRETDNSNPIFSSPQEFLDAFDRGLAIIRGRTGGTGYASIGLLDVGGGAGMRAAKELPKYNVWAQRHGVSAERNRNLYPIEGTEVNGEPRTFKGMLIETLAEYALSQEVALPISEMVIPFSAGQYAKHIRTKTDASRWKEDMLLWCQQEAQRYDLNDEALTALPEFYPAGHGDNPRLAHTYGIMGAMREVGVKTVISTNGDEFIWVLLLPAFLGASQQRGTLDQMTMLAVPNANGQFGGYFGNGLQVETPCIPDSYVSNQRPPATLNTTFLWGNLERVIAGFDQLAAQPPQVSIVSKPTVVRGRFIHMVGLETWMGYELTAANRCGGGTLVVDEITRNLFDGLKGPQQAADHAPQGFLHGLGYADYYTLVAKKISGWRETLLGKHGAQARFHLAERMMRYNFDPILVAMDEAGNLPDEFSRG
ncbi:MAG: hypothetical protein QME05_05270 [Candidatus Margulisbacteria bacterium]|nr:hypothetical protein [Candidatus Margulisiibacteriota bacterium]